MIVWPLDSEELKRAKRNYNKYSNIVDKIDDKLSSIQTKMEDIESTICKERELMDSYNDSANGRFNIIYCNLGSRHSYRLGVIYNHFDEWYNLYIQKRNQYEEQTNYWYSEVNKLK